MIPTQSFKKFKPLIFLAIIFPSLLWSYEYINGSLGVNPIEKLMALRGVSYNRIDRDINETRLGFIAQEVEEVLPEVVNENEYPDGSKYKGVSTTDMIPYLIKMNNELENRLKKLEN